VSTHSSHTQSHSLTPHSSLLIPHSLPPSPAVSYPQGRFTPSIDADLKELGVIFCMGAKEAGEVRGRHRERLKQGLGASATRGIGSAYSKACIQSAVGSGFLFPDAPRSTGWYCHLSQHASPTKYCCHDDGGESKCISPCVSIACIWFDSVREIAWCHSNTLSCALLCVCLVMPHRFAVTLLVLCTRSCCVRRSPADDWTQQDHQHRWAGQCTVTAVYKLHGYVNNRLLLVTVLVSLAS
jgi:hypothetical protein